MKNLLKRTIILIFIVSVNSCQTKSKIENFNVEIRDFDGSAGYMLNYKINKDSLKIHYDCDFENCKDTIIYAIELNKRKTSEFYKYLKLNKTDTLKTRYREDGFDGLNLYVKISGDSLKPKKIKLERYFHPEIKKLIVDMDKLIPEEKYKYFRENK